MGLQQGGQACSFLCPAQCPIPNLTAPLVLSDALWHPAGSHLQPLGIHSLANLGCRSHSLNTARCDCLELLQPTAQGRAQTGAGLLLVRAALHRGCTERLHRVGTAETDRRCITERDGQYKGMGPQVCWIETHHVVVNAPTRPRPQGSCAQHSSAPDYLPPPHFTPSGDLATSQGQQRPPTNFSASIASRCQGHPSPSIFPPSSSILEPFWKVPERRVSNPPCFLVFPGL